MTPADDAPIPELSPEEKARVYAHFAKQFTVERLLEYVNDDAPGTPAEQVLAEADEWLKQFKRSREAADAQ